MARKPQVAELKLRVPVELHRTLKSAARKNHWSVNQEVNQRLQRSFVDQGVEALAQTVAMEVSKLLSGKSHNSPYTFNIINRKKEEDSNG